MEITVNLWSGKTGEIKRFLDKYYDREILLDDDAGHWLHVCKKPADAVDIISAVIDNHDKFQIKVYIQVNEGQYHQITIENHNDIIKDIFYLTYNCEQVN